jgi:hypothetical protein
MSRGRRGPRLTEDGDEASVALSAIRVKHFHLDPLLEDDRLRTSDGLDYCGNCSNRHIARVNTVMTPRAYRHCGEIGRFLSYPARPEVVCVDVVVTTKADAAPVTFSDFPDERQVLRTAGGWALYERIGHAAVSHDFLRSEQNTGMVIVTPRSGDTSQSACFGSSNSNCCRYAYSS